jgi:chromodomain-helicase-DNA-binding protein 1
MAVDSASSDSSSDDSDAAYGGGSRRRKKRNPSVKSSRGRSKHPSRTDSSSLSFRYSSRNQAVVNYADDDEADEFADEFGDEFGEEDYLQEQQKRRPQTVMEQAEDVNAETAIEQVMDHRLNAKDHNTTEFLIRWRGQSHLHNTWESLDSLQHYKGFKKVENYVKANLVVGAGGDFEDEESRLEKREMNQILLEDYITVERVIESRRSWNGETEYLCKWKTLPYAECTWEAASVISERFQDRIDEFLNRQQSHCVPYRSNRYPDLKSRKAEFRRLTSQPDYITEGRLREYQLEGVSWLAYLWSTNTNGILADEMGLGKTGKY